MPTTETTTLRDSQLVRSILARATGDLAMIIDRELSVGSVSCSRSDRRIGADGSVHLSFRLEFRVGETSRQGCLLMPLPDAISIAGYLMVMPDETVKARRKDTSIDRSTKDAMLEISNFLGGSADQVLRDFNHKGELSARSAGCQGVAAGAIPNFLHGKEEELIVANIELTLHEHPPFQAILMLPALLTD